MSYAKLCKRVQKPEIIDQILVELRKTPKITNLQLALKLRVHRNTISKYRKYIRRNYYRTPQEIVNKIDSRLEEDLDTMTHSSLLSYRNQLVPQKAEITTEHHEKLTKEFHATINISELPKSVKRKILEAEEALADAETDICQV